VLVHRLAEIDTPAFLQFLQEAADSFQKNVKRLQTKPEDVMPWKLNGERWHLGEKGFRPGVKMRWDRAILPKLLALVREVEPKVIVEWDARDAITLRVLEVGRGWATWRTKDNEALDCRFLGKRGQFNLAQLEGLGVSQEINNERGAGDGVRLLFQQMEQIPAAKWKQFLADHLRGFRETFER
jgi:excinuclease ABC subunit A